MQKSKIKPRERDAILPALRAGVVPRLGLQHLQVGRAAEIKELLRDVERVADQGSAIRFIIGEYGAGKTFFMNLVRLMALEKGLVALSADLAPERRLYGSGGQARALYGELARNTSTRTKPDGGALPSVVERFVTQAIKQAKQNDVQVEQVVRTKLSHLEELVGGYDFATVIARYWEGHDTGNEGLKSAALRWLRGEYSTKTDAKAALGVRTIIDDANVYDQLKLLAVFFREAGYKGLLVVFDEMVNLYKLINSRARNQNYEQILRILNDVLQGNATGLGVILGGTPEFLMDPRRGLYSYEALQSRLAENTFSSDVLVDLSGPVVRLQNLMPEDLYVLLRNIRFVFAAGRDTEEVVPDAALKAFMEHCNERIGEAYFRTPRNTVRAFIDLLSILEQNPGTRWAEVLGTVEIAPDTGEDLTDIDDRDDHPQPADEKRDDDDLASFKL